MSHPKVTVVCVPRERFSYTKPSLDSIFAETQIPFELIYVDGNSPEPVANYLKDQSIEKGFKLIRADTYLTPNQARNIGLAHVKTPYLVFFDNDVVVSPGWLKALVNCAEETGADVVGPLQCHCYEPEHPMHSVVHFAGGQAHVWEDKMGRRRLREKMNLQGKSVVEVKDTLQRTETELAEFHCVLVRKAVFDDKLGQLDEGMLCTKEHLDFCMSVRDAGGSVYFEPSSIVTYVPGVPENRFDLHYYMLRWSNDWTLRSLSYMREKWNLFEDEYFKAKTRHKKLGWRRFSTILMPLSHKMTMGFQHGKLARLLQIFEYRLNNYLVRRNRQQQDSLQIEEA